MRVWHQDLIPKLCSRHLVAVHREARGAYKIITEKRTDLSYHKHPATQEFIECPEALHKRMQAVCDEADKRGYNFQRPPELVVFGGEVKEWQSLEQQIEVLKSKNCKCNI